MNPIPELNFKLRIQFQSWTFNRLWSYLQWTKIQISFILIDTGEE